MPTGYVSEPTTELGARLRELRTRPRKGYPNGLSQWEFAIELGTQANRIGDWELGKHIPSLPLLKKIAEVHGLTVSGLLRGVM